MERRSFLKTIGGIAVSSTFIGSKIKGADKDDNRPEFNGILVDTTMCVGCRSCEFACAEYHNFPESDSDDAVFDKVRSTSTNQFTLVNRYETDAGEVFVKKQCMHCSQPACASACLTKAMLKTEEGPVIWREDKCMGCRFCMISCPFDIPKFEYDSAVPKIQKCNMCWERLKKNELPACVDACPAEAIIFGKRGELIEEARRRIYADPDSYIPRIYGENEVGGTGYLYISGVPFEQLGFRTDLGSIPYPDYTKDFLYAVPIILSLWPPFLLALNNATKRDKEEIEIGGIDGK